MLSTDKSTPPLRKSLNNNRARVDTAAGRLQACRDFPRPGTPYSRHRSGTPSESAGTQSVRCKHGQPHRLTLRRPLSPALTIHRRCPGKHSRRMIALFADKLIISTENNSLACRSEPGPQPNRYPRAIQTSETTPCVVLRSDGKARYASYPLIRIVSFFELSELTICQASF